MTRYVFVLLAGDQETFLRKIRDLGILDITRSAKPVDAHSSDLLAEAQRLQKAITLLQGVRSDKNPRRDAILAALPAEVPAGGLDAVFENASRIDSLKEQLTAARRERKAREPWGRYDKAALDALAEQGLTVRYYKVAGKAFDTTWAERIPLQVVREDGKEVWFVTVSEAAEDRLPLGELPAPTGTLADSDRQIERLEEEWIRSQAELLRRKDVLPDLEARRAAVGQELDLYLADAAAESAAEEHLSVFTGFAPTKDDDMLARSLDELPAFWMREPAKAADNPPIQLHNNRFTRMFTVLTDMYGRPNYNEFDPTPWLSVFFLLFFAMCMGDAGYGLVLVIGGLLMRRMKGMADLAPLVTTLGVGTFIVGIVMHTFFGVDIAQLAWVPAWLKKCMVTGTIGGFEANMVIALVIGVIHLCLAMIVKTVYATRNRGFLGSLGVWGWTLLIVGGVIVAALALGKLLSPAALKWTVIGLGILSAAGIFLLNDIHRNPLKNIGAGLWETYNTVTGLLGDVLSYLRLYALGLAGGMLGKAFNDIATMTLGDGGFGPGWIFFILILVVGHALNLAMCCLGAFVHPLRLNFLEFFKNSGYEGKGRTYKPLKNN